MSIKREDVLHVAQLAELKVTEPEVAALVPQLNLHEDEDFEHLVRAGPGQLHGGGTLDTDRLIVARRMGIGRATKEEAPTTI